MGPPGFLRPDRVRPGGAWARDGGPMIGLAFRSPPMTDRTKRLSDTQRLLLTAAGARTDYLIPLPKVAGGGSTPGDPFHVERGSRRRGACADRGCEVCVAHQR